MGLYFIELRGPWVFITKENQPKTTEQIKPRFLNIKNK